MINIVIIAYLYILLEWSFYLTQASISFMYKLNFGEKFIIYLVCSLLTAVMGVVLVFLFGVIDLIAGAIFPKLKSYLVVFPESLLLSIFALTALDNFTYTVFHFGLSTANRLEEIPYLLAFLAFNFFVTRSLAKPSKGQPRWIMTGKLIAAAALVVISLVGAGIRYYGSDTQPSNVAVTTKSDKPLPNIIIFGTDGLSATAMSLYGAVRDTTPNLDKLASTLLISENNFTNAGHSMGSDVSMLSSKSPLETRVLYPPDILQGSDVDETLPNLLSSLGYETVQLAVPHYADADSANIEGAFDSINCSDSSQFLYQANRLFLFRLNDEFYMLNSILNNAEERLKGAFLIEKMDNPIADILNLQVYGASDKERMSCLFNYLDEARSTNKPLFAHVHMLSTHGSLFYPINVKYSKGMIQTANWMDEFYADSIIDYDMFAQQLIDYLKANNEYNNTIIVFEADHGEQWSSDRRIVLAFHFPNDEYAGKITANTQNMDISPTLLDYIGVDQPSWMTGSSLLKPIPTNRMIVSTYTKEIEGDDSGLWGINSGFIHPPFYQFSIVRVMECQEMVTFDMEKSKVTTSTVTNYVAPCAQDSLDSANEIKEKVGQLLTQYGFDLPDGW
jgi:hypothetical protein